MCEFWGYGTWSRDLVGAERVELDARYPCRLHHSEEIYPMFFLDNDWDLVGNPFGNVLGGHCKMGTKSVRDNGK